MADLPIVRDRAVTDGLGDVMDVEGKLVRALEALGPVAGQDVLAVGDPGEPRMRGLDELGARTMLVSSLDEAPGRAEGSADVIVGWWTAFRGVDTAELHAADRLLRPDGRLLVVHDYGRDDVSRLFGDRPEYGPWSRRDGPFLSGGFRIRVIHCFWTFASLDEAGDRLEAVFGEPGRVLAAGLKRPRLSWNVAVYHRSRAGAPPPT